MLRGMSLSGKTLFISGASRGIGLAIALRAARDGANVALIAKTAEPHPKLEGTVYTAAAEIEAAGGSALPIVGDIRDDAQVEAAVAQAVERFGGIDVCVNNASAINLARTEALDMKRYDLMQDINVRGTFAVSRACIPHLRSAENPHILTLSPPITIEDRWLGPHIGYTLAKYGMSLCALGFAAELREDGIASNALWPRTLIATAAVQNLLGGEAAMERSRKPELYADAAYAVVTRPSRECTGNTYPLRGRPARGGRDRLRRLRLRAGRRAAGGPVRGPRVAPAGLRLSEALIGGSSATGSRRRRSSGSAASTNAASSRNETAGASTVMPMTLATTRPPRFPASQIRPEAVPSVSSDPRSVSSSTTGSTASATKPSAGSAIRPVTKPGRDGERDARAGAPRASRPSRTAPRSAAARPRPAAARARDAGDDLQREHQPDLAVADAGRLRAAPRSRSRSR